MPTNVFKGKPRTGRGNNLPYVDGNMLSTEHLKTIKLIKKKKSGSAFYCHPSLAILNNIRMKCCPTGAGHSLTSHPASADYWSSSLCCVWLVLHFWVLFFF
jgi:hypothetical protein